MPVTLRAIGINVERAVVPDDAFGLDLQALGVPVAMAMNGNRGSHRNDAFFETCALSTGWWGQGDVPDFVLGAHFHRRMRSCKANTGFHCACEFEFLIEISRPAVVGRSWKSGK